MASHEKQFQIRVCKQLRDKAGYLWTPPEDLELERVKDANMPQTDARQFDRRHGLYAPDTLTYLSETQPLEYGKLFPASLTPGEQQSRQDAWLDKLAAQLNKPYKRGGGLMYALTHEFKSTVAGITTSFKLAQLPPESQDNVSVLSMYDGNIFRVIHEVAYSIHKQDAIDLVGTLNGLPVWTQELKNGATQTVDDAVHQYRYDRTPWAVDKLNRRQGNQAEPLLNGARAVVHFAVDPSEVKMTTRLNGEKTHFLPFNPGEDYQMFDDGDPDALTTDFLWQDTLERRSLLAILKNFVQQSTVEERNQETGKMTSREKTLFPRFHQWFGVTVAAATVLREGPGQVALMMWSAGSGKSLGITWLSYELATLHYDDPSYGLDSLTPRVRAEVLKHAPEVLHTHANGKVFTGGGFVITDRKNLDDQLKKDIRAKGHVTGFVASIGDASSSKSAQLREELTRAGSGIKILTIQTFPHALDSIQAMGEAGRIAPNLTYFVIRDEAHTSEGGKNSTALSEILNASTFAPERLRLKERVEAEDLSEAEAVDELMLLRQQTKADHSRVSYFAFTATPKAKTLERFGRADAGPEQRALHTYSMAEAIEEGYILDVLQNYTTHEVAATLAASSAAGQRLVDADRSEKTLQAWVRRQPETMEAKAEIIVDHFLTTGFNSLADQAAQAMVFTSSREEALRYKHVLDDVIQRRGLAFNTLVAFSGELTDARTGEIVTESEANQTSKHNMAQLFEDGVGKGQPYHFLIVADKYQTGYDNPRLVCGYIDKQVREVTAVQLLSRFNRTADSLGKHAVYILDFANDFDDIVAAFGMYRGKLSLGDKTDPNRLHDIQREIDMYGYHDIDLVHAYYAAGLKHDRLRQGKLLTQAKEAWRTDLKRAEEAENTPEADRLRKLIPLLHRYVLVYGHMSTLINYADSEVEALAEFYSGLYGALTTLSRSLDRTGNDFDFDGIGIISTKIRQKDSTVSPYTVMEPLHVPKNIDQDNHDDFPPELVYLKDLISYLNQLFGSLPGVEATDYQAFIEHVINTAQQSPDFMELIRSNDPDRLLNSSMTRDEIMQILVNIHGTWTAMVNNILSDEKAIGEVSRGIVKTLHMRAGMEI